MSVLLSSLNAKKCSIGLVANESGNVLLPLSFLFHLVKRGPKHWFIYSAYIPQAPILYQMQNIIIGVLGRKCQDIILILRSSCSRGEINIKTRL